MQTLHDSCEIHANTSSPLLPPTSRSSHLPPISLPPPFHLPPPPEIPHDSWSRRMRIAFPFVTRHSKSSIFGRSAAASAKISPAEISAEGVPVTLRDLCAHFGFGGEDVYAKTEKDLRKVLRKERKQVRSGPMARRSSCTGAKFVE